MSLNHIIALAIGVAAVAVAAPQIAPALLQGTATPPVEEAAAPSPARPADRQPVSRIEVVRDAPEPAPPPQVSSGRRVALRADQRGHFEVDATINGRSIDAIVDTGATAVALNEETARRVGIFLSRGDYTMPISTANGVIGAAPVTLSQIRIGNIVVHNVQAVVVPGEVLATNLLGMTFLSRLTRFEVAGGQLVLTQ